MDNKKYLTEADVPFTPMTAAEEAARCLLCHDAPCSKGCPAGTDPGKFIRSIRFRNTKGAAETIRKNNILGGVCARVCPYDKLCELECSRCGIDSPIQIGKLQRFATDMEKACNMQVLKKGDMKEAKVAVIGSGPAGLTVAAALAVEGYSVTVFEEKELPGGWIAYGIPPARLPEQVVEDEIDYVKKLGVEFVLNCKIGKDKTIDELKSDGFQAFFVGIGTSLAKNINIPGVELKNVITAADFLAAARTKKGNVAVGADVVVVGGGDVAMDCATTAKLLGAKNVSAVFVESLDIMPANKDEKTYARELGVNFYPAFKPLAITGDGEKATAFTAQGLDINDDTDMFNIPAIPEVKETSLQLKADLVVIAVGQKADNVKAIADIETKAGGLVVVNEETHATNVPGIYAAGDVVNGGKTVVQAVKCGKTAAAAIVQYLTKEGGK